MQLVSLHVEFEGIFKEVPFEFIYVHSIVEEKGQVDETIAKEGLLPVDEGCPVLGPITPFNQYV